MKIALPPYKRVNKSPAQAVAVELINRGGSKAYLAGLIGVSKRTLDNILCGCNPGKDAWKRIEWALLMPIVSTQEEFWSRLETPEKLKAYKVAICERAAGQIAGQENCGKVLQQITAKLGLTIVVAQFNASPGSPVWSIPNAGEPFAEEMRAAHAGLFDSVLMTEGGYFAFYHASDLAKALAVLKRCLEEHSLLNHARIFYIEAESAGWRTVWPATGELVLASPWNT